MGGPGKEEKKGSALGKAVVAGASVALGYAALELGLGGVLKPGREAIGKSLEPQQDEALQPQEEAQAQEQASKLVQEVEDDAEVQENKTHTPMAQEQVAASLQQHAAASPDVDTNNHH